MAVQITVPPEDHVENLSSNVAVLTSAEGDGGGGAVRMNSEARIINQNSSQDEIDTTAPSSSGGGGGATAPSQPSSSSSSSPSRQPRAYQVVIPPNVRPGTNFPVLLNGQQIQVQCPLNARPGMTLRINPPPSLLGPPAGMQSATDLSRPPDRPGQGSNSGNGNGNSNSNTGGGSRMVNQMFEVTVPQGVRPNQPFSLLAGGQRVLVTCPPNARPGTRIRFNLPVPVGGSGKKAGGNDSNKKKDVTLKYDTQDGWTRSIRVTDMKFTWVRLDHDGELGTDDGTFRVDTSAYVRKVVFLQGNDMRMRTGKVSLIPASEYSVDSVIGKDPDAKNVSSNSKDELLVGEGELANVQTKSMEEKVSWLLKTCKKLGIPWEEGHMRICVRREHLLVDSIQAVMSLGRKDLRKIWRFEFMGEDGIDAGGLAKEWFLLVTKAIFDADSGLWVSSEGNQMLMRINPASEATCPEDHLIYFRFLGRVLGKAVFEGQLVSGHMVQYLYKYLLGWPITFDDLESVDADLYNNLKKLLDVNPEDVEYLCLDFTAAQTRLGETVQVKLVPDGEEKAVTGDNLSEYLEVYFKYIMLERIKPQLTVS